MTRAAFSTCGRAKNQFLMCSLQPLTCSTSDRFSRGISRPAESGTGQWALTPQMGILNGSVRQSTMRLEQILDRPGGPIWWEGDKPQRNLASDLRTL